MAHPPVGRGRHMVLPAWMTRGEHAVPGGSTSATQIPAGPTPPPKILTPGVPLPSSPSPQAPAPAAVPAVAVVAAAAPPASRPGGRVGRWLEEPGYESDGRGEGRARRSRSQGHGRRDSRDVGRRGSRDRDGGDRDRYRVDRDRDARSRTRSRDRGKDYRDLRRERGSTRGRSRSRSGDRDRIDRDRDRARSGGRERRRSPVSEYEGDQPNASILAGRIVEIKQMLKEKRKAHREAVEKWCSSSEFRAEDRQGTALSTADFVDRIVNFEHKVTVTKRLCAEENASHSFAMDFEKVDGGKNEIVLYECKKGRLVRAYAFRDSENIVESEISMEKLKDARIYQKVVSYVSKKGVKDESKISYIDYSKDSIVIG